MGISKLSQFAEFAGDSSGSIAIINDSQNLQTYKIVKETLFTSSLYGTSSWAGNSITASTTYLSGINGLSNSGSSTELGGNLYKNTIISGTKDGTMNYLYPRSTLGPVRSFALDHTGDYIYMAGTSGSSEEDWFTPGGILKVNRKTNEVDTSFNLSGTGISGFITGSFRPSINDIKVTPNGKFYILGNFSTYNGVSSKGIARINPDGSIDNTFNPGVGFNGFNQNNYPFTIVWGLIIDEDNKLVAFGSFNSYSGSNSNGIIRINENGTVDTSFSAQTFNGVVTDVKQAANKKLYCGGTFTNSPYGNRIVRLNSSGSVDATFSKGTGLNGALTHTLPNCLYVDSQDRVTAVGQFTTYNGASSPRIVRINSNGSRDTTFSVGSGLVGTVAGSSYGQVYCDEIGRLYVVGTYVTYKGVTKSKFIRILPNGDLDLDFYSGNGFIVSPSEDNLTYGILLNNNRLYLSAATINSGSVFSYNGQSLGTSRTYIINVNENNLILSSSLVKYDEDNLASFTSRSLIDKDYADNRVARLATGSVTASLSNTAFTVNTGSLFTGSLSVSESVNITRFFSLLTVSSSFDFIDDTAAGNAGIPLAGIYRSGSVLRIRLQ